jgi:hypothetical protein
VTIRPQACANQECAGRAEAPRTKKTLEQEKAEIIAAAREWGLKRLQGDIESTTKDAIPLRRSASARKMTTKERQEAAERIDGAFKKRPSLPRTKSKSTLSSSLKMHRVGDHSPIFLMSAASPVRAEPSKLQVSKLVEARATIYWTTHQESASQKKSTAKPEPPQRRPETLVTIPEENESNIEGRKISRNNVSFRLTVQTDACAILDDGDDDGDDDDGETEEEEVAKVVSRRATTNNASSPRLANTRQKRTVRFAANVGCHTRSHERSLPMDIKKQKRAWYSADEGHPRRPNEYSW